MLIRMPCQHQQRANSNTLKKRVFELPFAGDLKVSYTER
jgi:hypothetical protein